MQNLNKDKYYCNPSDYEIVPHQEYFNLKIIPKIGELEREIGLINDLSEIIVNPNLIYIGGKYSSFFTLNCKEKFEKITIFSTCEDEEFFIHKNIKNTSNIFLEKDVVTINENSIIKIHHDINIELTESKPIILSREKEYFNNLYSHKFKLSNSEQVLYIPEQHFQTFFDNFYYYLLNDTIEYDNLINLCIMVKNGGDLFEKVLTENLSVIDRWTILDTGSTDNTIDLINKVLVGKKKGNLYEEPFINFRESRNRCLELAGKKCKFNLILDDTYIIKENLRKFLNLVRGDQFADSYSLLIKSDDVEYYSNRVIKSKNNLKYIYTIHEVIQKDDNINVVIPVDQAWIHDERADYMNDRTMNRKEYDLKCLFEMIEEYPDNSRHVYYIAQTYNLLEKYELAAEYFQKRAFHHDEGFLQEKYDALFEMTRIYNFKLNKPWDECEKYYKLLIEWEPDRPEPFYFIGIHYHLEGNNDKAYEYFKKSYEIGYPISKQYSLKPTLSYYFTPKFLAPLCYFYKNYKLGQECCYLFLTKNKVDEVVKGDIIEFETIRDWYNIFTFLNKLNINPTPIKPKKEIFAFVADGGYNSWSGSSINRIGVGGSETFIIEMARNLAKCTDYEIIVFCNCEFAEEYEGVKYLHLSEYFNYCSNIEMKHVMISRYSEYIPVAINGYVENIYVILHDLKLTGNIVPIHPKIKNIFCLSEWHKKYFLSSFPQFNNITSSFGYGIDFENFLYDDKIEKNKHSFIYSSFPNRGLIVLLKMWDKIKERYNDASLNIFVNLNNTWVNQNYKEEIIEIRRLLEELKDKDIINHEWVSKKTLGEYWKKSEIWFYPCKFAETFCLTALEAALSKTLCITNNLAALQDTVGDRGINVDESSDDVMSQEWQDKAFNTICEWIDNEERFEYINKNYNRAITQSWYNRAETLADILRLDKKKKELLYPIEIKDVGNFYAYEHDFITEYIKQHGNWESEYDEIFSKYLNENSVCIDIGAFIGTNTVKMANKCGKVYSFEPFEQSYNLLKKNLIFNNIKNVEILNLAVGNENKIIHEMFYPENLEQYNNISNVGAMRLTYDFRENLKKKVNVEMIQLDNYFFNQKIDLIKIDCEGSELDVIKGSKYLIQKFKPILLLENFEREEILKEVWKELEGLEYKYIKLSNVNGMFYSEDNLDYGEMYNWTHDLPTCRDSRKRFLSILERLKDIENCEILEIGVNIGTSLIHILKNLKEYSLGTAIDIWKDETIERRCLDNFKKSHMLDRIKIMKGDSTDRLLELIKDDKKFDFIYVDGSHTLCDTYSDCLLAWHLLKKDGIMGINDYTMIEDEEGRKEILYLPYEGVNEFLKKYKSKINILDQDYRLFLQKIEE